MELSRGARITVPPCRSPLLLSWASLRSWELDLQPCLLGCLHIDLKRDPVFHHDKVDHPPRAAKDCISPTVSTPTFTPLSMFLTDSRSTYRGRVPGSGPPPPVPRYALPGDLFLARSSPRANREPPPAGPDRKHRRKSEKLAVTKRLGGH